MSCRLYPHEQKHEVKAACPAGWWCYRGKIDDSYLGTGVVVAPSYLLDYLEHRSVEKAQSQLDMATKLEQSTIVFYAGFGWQKSGQFASAAAWDAYLVESAPRLTISGQLALTLWVGLG